MNGKAQRSPRHLAWLDLEMTGLDVENDAILQAALIITNAELEPLASLDLVVWQPDETLGRMTPFVRQMHEKNGLIDRVRASTVDLRAAERQLLSLLTAWCDYPAMLCGNTIGTDRRFVDRYFPGVAAYLHYRMVDVTSLKVLVGLWQGSSSLYAKPETRAHDALFDIEQSIAELKHYRHLLFPRPDVG